MEIPTGTLETTTCVACRNVRTDKNDYMKRTTNKIVLMLLGTDALILGMLLLMPVRVRTVVLVGDVFFSVD